MIRTLLFSSLLILAIPAYADFKEGGDAYKRGDYETAVKEFLPLANNGDHRAMYALGSMYAAGHGVERDLGEAFRWFQKAARYGRPDAEYKIGLMYHQGLGVEQNYKRALNWYGKAARKGFGSAHYQIGLMYLAGNGVEKDLVKARAWSLLAEELGEKRAATALKITDNSLSDEQKNQAVSLLQNLREKYSPRRQ
ncbi:MAG TPA: tetratricopeptide repeat protein [Gammaproteobacteria bacterium]|nr:tetratricopeptide repeat protein [Gammaproteobacteria bacterium]